MLRSLWPVTPDAEPSVASMLTRIFPVFECSCCPSLWCGARCVHTRIQLWGRCGTRIRCACRGTCGGRSAGLWGASGSGPCACLWHSCCCARSVFGTGLRCASGSGGPCVWGPCGRAELWGAW